MLRNTIKIPEASLQRPDNISVCGCVSEKMPTGTGECMQANRALSPDLCLLIQLKTT